MDMKSIVRSASIGTATGIAIYSLSRTTNRKKKSMKRSAGRAIKAVGSIIDDITSMMY